MTTLGELLQTTRLRKKLTLEEVAKATKIKATFLSAIERGEYYKLPSPAYAKGFAQNYGEYLGLSKKEIIALFRREFDEKKAYKVLPQSLTRKRISSFAKFRIQESLIFIGLLLILFSGFLFFHYRAMFFAPALSISSPQAETKTKKEVVVQGKTDSDVMVFVNDDQVEIDQQGAFTKELLLSSGRAEITVKAVNTFGKETVVTREIVVE